MYSVTKQYQTARVEFSEAGTETMFASARPDSNKTGKTGNWRTRTMPNTMPKPKSARITASMGAGSTSTMELMANAAPIRAGNNRIAAGALAAAGQCSMTPVLTIRPPRRVARVAVGGLPRMAIVQNGAQQPYPVLFHAPLRADGGVHGCFAGA